MVVARNQSAGLDGWPALAWAMAYGALGTWLFVASWRRGRARRLELALRRLDLLSPAALGFRPSRSGAYFALLRQVWPRARCLRGGDVTPIVALLVSAALEGYDWKAATFAGIALAVAGNIVALQRSVNSRA